MNRSRVTGDLASHGNIFVDIANDRVGIGSTIPGQKLSLPDNAKIALGNSADLQLWHTGGDGLLYNNTGQFYIRGGGGSLTIQSNSIRLRNDGNTEDLAKFTANGAVELYYDNSKKLETTGYGINITAHSDIRFTNGNWTGDITNAKIQLHNNILYIAGGTEGIMLREGGTDRWRVDQDGNFDPATDALYDIGQSNLRVRRGYFEDLYVSDDFDVTDDLTIGGELNLIGSSDSAKYFDVRLGTSNSLNIRSTSGGDSNHVTMMSLSTSGASIVGDLSLGDGTADSAAGPEFKLNRNSASPANADYLGQIKFAGRSSTGVERNYAKITGKILDVTNGSEDGILEFAHIKAGSQVITGRWRSDSLQLLNSTNLSVAGTSTFENDVTIQCTGDANLNLVADTGNNNESSVPTINFTQDGGVNVFKVGVEGTAGETFTGSTSNTPYLITTTGHGGMSLDFGTNNALRMKLTTAALQPAADSTYDLGTNTIRWRRLYVDGIYDANTERLKVTNSGFEASGTLFKFSDTADTNVIINADTDNSNEAHHPSLSFKQDGTVHVLDIGVNGDTADYTGATHNFGYVRIGGHVNVGLEIATGNSTSVKRLTIDHNGHITPGADSSYDIGSNSVRFRNIYADTLYGDGSNITSVNATTLDSIDSGSFLRSDADDTTSGTLTITSSGNYPLDINGGQDAKIVLQGSSDPYIRFREGTTDKAYIQWQASGILQLCNQETGEYLNIGSSSTGLKFIHDGTTSTVWHAGNDGTGSGLDADLLDGQQASAFLGVNATANNSNALKIVDTRNDGARVPNDYENHKVTAEFTNQVINGWWSAITAKGWADGYAPWQLWGYSDTGQNINLYARFGHGGNNTWSSLYKIWHEGNDGSGSGLDADTLDGVQGASFLRSDADDTTTGKLHLTYTNTYPLDINGSDDGKIVLQGSSNPYIRFREGTTDRAYIQSHSNGNFYFVNQETGEQIYIASGGNGLKFVHDGTTSTVWHSGNDGSGTGLDADLWDGQQFASYLNQALLTSSTVSFDRLSITGAHGSDNAGWYRNTTSGEGIYNTATTQHFYSDDDDYWNIAGGGTANGLRFRDDHAGTVRGYVYSNNSNQIGFLNQSGSWTVRTETTGITKLGSNGYQLVNGNNSRNLKYISGDTGSTTDVGISGYNGGGSWRFQLYGASGNYGFLDANWAGWDIKKAPSGAFYVDEGSGLARVWNSLNDGSGSGLDADTVDGIQASSFLRSDANDNLGGTLSYTSNTARLQFTNSSYGQQLHIGGWSSANTAGVSRIRNSNDNLHLDCGANGQLHLNHYSLTNIVASTIVPRTNAGYDLGSSSIRWRDLYINDLALSNESKKDTGGNDVDGTWGDWRIQEGESDLFIINNRNGKKYKFNLTEVS